METTKKAGVSARTHEVSEDSKIIIKVKDAIAVAAFLIYIGMSVAGYFFARGKLESLEQGNQVLQEKVQSLQQDYRMNSLELKHIQEDIGEVKEVLNQRKK